MMNTTALAVDPKIIVALDFATALEAWHLVTKLEPKRCRLKVGKELFTAAGPSFVERLQTRGFDVFLDLKLHDIPNTVAQTCKVIASMGGWMTNVHALGGREMMEAAVEAMASFEKKPKLIAVTVLTSMSESDLAEVGIGNRNIPVLDEVMRLAKLAQNSGLDGVVCSAKEVGHLRFQLGDNFNLVTPGIRPVGASADDQERIGTPAGAIQSGASYLVIGRPITKAADPLLALNQIYEEVMSASRG